MWREGCPCILLKKGLYDQLQLLIHPIWWGDVGDLGILVEEVLQARMEEIKSYLFTNISPFRDIVRIASKHG